MIFVTVGTQLPFDRLIALTDEAAPSLSRPVFAQIGVCTYTPRNVEYSARLTPLEFDRLFSQADMIVSHAGIGTVLTAQKYRKPIVLFPRRAALGEHRNDHQLATVNALEGRSGIYIARTEDELRTLLGSTLTPPDMESKHPSREKLKSALANIIAGQKS